MSASGNSRRAGEARAGVGLASEITTPILGKPGARVSHLDVTSRGAAPAGGGLRLARCICPAPLPSIECVLYTTHSPRHDLMNAFGSHVRQVREALLQDDRRF